LFFFCKMHGCFLFYFHGRLQVYSLSTLRWDIRSEKSRHIIRSIRFHKS
jgi:hypothetical protein